MYDNLKYLKKNQRNDHTTLVLPINSWVDALSFIIELHLLGLVIQIYFVSTLSIELRQVSSS